MASKSFFNPILAVVIVAAFAFAGRVSAQTNDDIFKISDGLFSNHCEYHEYKINMGDEVVLANIEGPGKVTYFYITDANTINENKDWLHCFYPGLVLKVYWDDSAEPSINVPLADFFGAMNNNPVDFASRFLCVNRSCYMCYMPMPFSKKARFVVANDGDKNYVGTIAYSIDYEKDSKFASEKSRLHCVWNRTNPTNGLHKIVNIKGKGHYIGNVLLVKSNYGGWWGEGDTNFEVDGKFMTHTPGTEDEYGFCWGMGKEDKTFSAPDFGFVQNDGGTHLMYRWYNSNPVRFKKSLKVDIQNQRCEAGASGTPVSSDDFVSVAFWYQEGAHPVALQPYAERVAPSKAVRY